MVEIINGTVSPEVKDEILGVCRVFWESLAERDIEKRFSLCADIITFIGTGLNEKASNKEEYFEINRKGKEQFPHPFQIEFLWSRLSVTDDIAWVENEVEWQMEVSDLKTKNLVRNTVILKKIDGIWLIIHVHGSIPDYTLYGQNYMTSEETVKKNRELEGMVYQRTKDLNESLEILRSTQAQLIQSEKMASLGELTAGIAHEIQNPLNFVNNFSEVNEELLTEMKDELSKGKIEDAIALANDVIVNQKKINHHGKRADAIVKGMLQHSRSSSNQKEPTNINALADEYLRLAYHGLRAKDKSFNATMKTDFDETIGNINIVPQDIGRVILNLITNAFYVVNEKSKQNIARYEPTVEVNTRKEGGKVLVSVKDNGNGIPQKVLNKIFQPFFTTKPTGQGTGLGLSLSYDIVKAHGGELKVETKEGEGSTFTIQIPIN
jgi:signal transduction histidine kinase